MLSRRTQVSSSLALRARALLLQHAHAAATRTCCCNTHMLLQHAHAAATGTRVSAYSYCWCNRFIAAVLASRNRFEAAAAKRLQQLQQVTFQPGTRSTHECAHACDLHVHAKKKKLLQSGCIARRLCCSATATEGFLATRLATCFFVLNQTRRTDWKRLTKAQESERPRSFRLRGFVYFS